MKDAAKGFGYLREGIGLIRQSGLRRYVAVPLLVSTLVFSAAIYFGIHWLGVLLDWLLGYLPGWLNWLRYLLWPLFALTGVLVVFYTFSIITNLIAAPFNGLLAEAGSDNSKLLSATIWLADMRDYDAVNEVWDAWLPEGAAPARACVEAKLAFAKYTVEIGVIAAR